MASRKGIMGGGSGCDVKSDTTHCIRESFSDSLQEHGEKGNILAWFLISVENDVSVSPGNPLCVSHHTGGRICSNSTKIRKLENIAS